MSDEESERESPQCWMDDCENTAVAVYEGILEPCYTVRRELCDAHAPNFPPVRRFEPLPWVEEAETEDSATTTGGTGNTAYLVEVDEDEVVVIRERTETVMTLTGGEGQKTEREVVVELPAEWEVVSEIMSDITDELAPIPPWKEGTFQGEDDD